MEIKVSMEIVGKEAEVGTLMEELGFFFKTRQACAAVKVPDEFSESVDNAHADLVNSAVSPEPVVEVPVTPETVAVPVTPEPVAVPVTPEPVAVPVTPAAPIEVVPTTPAPAAVPTTAPVVDLNHLAAECARLAEAGHPIRDLLGSMNALPLPSATPETIAALLPKLRELGAQV